MLHLQGFLTSAILTPNFMGDENKAQEAKWVAQHHIMRSVIGRTGSSICQQKPVGLFATPSRPSWFALADTSEVHSFS